MIIDNMLEHSLPIKKIFGKPINQNIHSVSSAVKRDAFEASYGRKVVKLLQKDTQALSMAKKVTKDLEDRLKQLTNQFIKTAETTQTSVDELGETARTLHHQKGILSLRTKRFELLDSMRESSYSYSTVNQNLTEADKLEHQINDATKAYEDFQTGLNPPPYSIR